MNEHREHVYVLSEDQANRQILNGFLNHYGVRRSCVQCPPCSGGWRRVLEQFQAEFAPRMRGNAKCFVILLIDFDQQENRAEQVWTEIEEEIKDRVFLLGAWSEPEKLKGLGSREGLGIDLAEECRSGVRSKWNHEHLRHNGAELDRLASKIRPFLFDAA